MAHPQMFDDDDPWLERVREIALALPGRGRRSAMAGPPSTP